MTKRIIRVDHLKTPMTLYVGKETSVVATRLTAREFDNKKDLDWISNLWKSCGLIVTIEEVGSE